MTLEAQLLHKHRWLQGRVTLASFSMHTTQSITLPSSVNRTDTSQLQSHQVKTSWTDYCRGKASFLPFATSVPRQDMRSSLFPLRLESSEMKWTRLSGLGEVMHSDAGQDRLVRNSPFFFEPAANRHIHISHPSNYSALLMHVKCSANK